MFVFIYIVALSAVELTTAVTTNTSRLLTTTNSSSLALELAEYIANASVINRISVNAFTETECHMQMYEIRGLENMVLEAHASCNYEHSLMQKTLQDKMNTLFQAKYLLQECQSDLERLNSNDDTYPHDRDFLTCYEELHTLLSDVTFVSEGNARCVASKMDLMERMNVTQKTVDSTASEYHTCLQNKAWVRYGRTLEHQKQVANATMTENIAQEETFP